MPPVTQAPTSGSPDILTLLRQAAQVAPVPAATPTEVVLVDASQAPAVGTSVPTIPAPFVGTVVEEDPTIYATITLAGLKRHRPDLIKALGGHSRSAAPATAGSAPAAKGDAVADYQAYMATALQMLGSDPASVSGRRLQNMRTKYVKALQARGVVVSPETDVTFVINGARIDASWAGTRPENIPGELNA